MKSLQPIIVDGVRYYTIQQVQELFQISRRTVYNWIRKGKIRYSVSPGGRRYIFAEDLDMKSEDLDA